MRLLHLYSLLFLRLAGRYLAVGEHRWQMMKKARRSTKPSLNASGSALHVICLGSGVLFSAYRCAANTQGCENCTLVEDISMALDGSGCASSVPSWVLVREGPVQAH
ncbi:hypothetical protein FIBSPDRAFT_847241 [Athelia psychrophila]|uniref:Secreted protein n=1 Tax=Athelia psychrophila TaxID=1759441 RepID=A0A166WTW0_9AGAM|nr:hypothetical protein FIBSPDRAFT_847241 [Fibularhizoctonia sp. CBS 109695]